MKRDQHLKPALSVSSLPFIYEHHVWTNVIPSPSSSRKPIEISFFVTHFTLLAALLFDLRWMGVFNMLDKALRVKYGFVESTVRFDSPEQSYCRGSEAESRTPFLLLRSLIGVHTHAKRHFPVSKLVRAILIDKVAFLIAWNLGLNFRFHLLVRSPF